MIAAAVFKFVGGAHQADIAFLNQIEKVQTAIYIFLGNGNHQAQIGFDQIFLGALGFHFAVANDGQAVAEIGQGCAGVLLLLLQFPLELFDLAPARTGSSGASSFLISVLERGHLFRRSSRSPGQIPSSARVDTE